MDYRATSLVVRGFGRDGSDGFKNSEGFGWALWDRDGSDFAVAWHEQDFSQHRIVAAAQRADQIRASPAFCE
ncbi:MAG: hypothetical protein H0W74_07145 [Sphingosinicella sp.]|nr:hypothetical protein [Sphingosinicella sp.]